MMPVYLISKQMRREILIHWRQPRTLLLSLLFFLMILLFFPLALPQDKQLLLTITPGLLWVTALLAFLFASERLFQQDYQDGVIEQWLISGYPLRYYIWAKIGVHWLACVVPLCVISPVIMILFHLTGPMLLTFLAGFLLGTPALFFLCALAAALSSGQRQTGLLIALILLPLALPIMIFGSGALNMMQQGGSANGCLALLAAFSLLSCAFLPIAIGAIIRVNLVD